MKQVLFNNLGLDVQHFHQNEVSKINSGHFEELHQLCTLKHKACAASSYGRWHKYKRKVLFEVAEGGVNHRGGQQQRRQCSSVHEVPGEDLHAGQKGALDLT